MLNTTCDVCRKKMDNAMTGRNFFYYAKHSVCEVCKDNLEGQVKSQVRNKTPFAYAWYAKFIDDSLDKAIQKGKI